MKVAGNIADDALVHFGKSTYSTVKPLSAGSSRWFRYGDIKNLTPKQIEALIGDLAEGGVPGNARVMHVVEPGAIPSNVAVKSYTLGYKEYFIREPVKPTSAVQVQE